MERDQLLKLTDEELLIEKKKLQKSKILHAVLIGFLAGITFFGTGAFIMSPTRQFGFLIPIMIPIIFIWRTFKNDRKNKALEEVLKERNLS